MLEKTILRTCPVVAAMLRRLPTTALLSLSANASCRTRHTVDRPSVYTTGFGKTSLTEADKVIPIQQILAVDNTLREVSDVQACECVDSVRVPTKAGQ